MKANSLSALVVECKDYKPVYNWNLRRSDGYIYGTPATPDDIGYDAERLRLFESSDDYVVMPECPNMTDEEAAEVVRRWCTENDIPFKEDLEDIELAYRGYYDY